MERLGTYASYQGIPCVAVEFNDARGIGAQVSRVVIPAPPLEGQASTFDWSAWVVGQLDRPAELELPPDLAASFADARRPAIELARGLRWEGTLTLAEDPGQPFSVPGLVVNKIDALDGADAGQAVRFYQLSLVDWRFFLGRGACPQATFNALRADGTVRLDTTKPDGSRYTLADVVERLREGIWRRPKIAHTPAAWRKDTREVRFRLFEPIATALPALCALGGAVQPCKHLDGSLAFYAAGEGKVGWARNGQGENTEDLPPGDTAGATLSWEATWPEEFVMVVGGPRVATTAVDDSEWVILIDGAPALLNEQLVRALTGGRYGLAWLNKILMLPASDHYADGVREEVVKLLTEQAYRFARLRGAEQIDPESQRYNGAPGPNAHLLPLLDRAETVGGSRRAVTVEAYGWDTQRKRFERATQAGQELSQANESLAQIRQDVKTELLRQGKFENPLEQARPRLATDGAVANVLRREPRQGLSLGEMIGYFSTPVDLDRAKVEALLNELRRVALLKKTLPTEAAAYEAALNKRVAAQSEQGDGTAAIALTLAKTLFGYETEAANSSNSEAGLREDFEAGFRARALGAVRQAANQMREARKAFAARRDAGVAGADFLERVHLRNKPRRVDGSAQIVSRDLGVVRLSGLGGHVAKEDVSDPALTEFVPRSVRIVFGAVTRPRIDAAPGRVPTGSAKKPDEFGGRDFIPAALSEQESVYTSTWRRVAQGKVEAALGAPLDRVTVVRQPWQELIPLISGVEADGAVDADGNPVARDQAGGADVVGESNKAQLDEDARKLAVQLASRPDRVKDWSVEVVGPWPVQCNGVVAAVQIVMGQKGGGPCGFTTRVLVDTESSVPASTTRERGR